MGSSAANLGESIVGAPTTRKSAARGAQRLAAAFFALTFCLGALSPVVAAASQVPSPVRIDAAHVSITIDHHYAVTTLEETLTNPSLDGWQHVVRVAAPELAFITRFALSEGGLTYESRIEASEQARGEYNATVSANQAAALVESR